MPEKLISRFKQSPEHFPRSVDLGVATITLNREERKNPLTFGSYAKIQDFLETSYIRKKLRAL